MQQPPAGWPRITPAVYYDDPRAAIDWLCRAFGFEVRLKVEGEGGRIEHSELHYGDGLIMVSAANTRQRAKDHWQANHASPNNTGKNTQSLAVFVDDVDAHCGRAVAAGAQVFRDLRTENYGDEYWSDRTYGALDLEGHQWWFMQRVRDAKASAQP